MHRFRFAIHAMALQFLLVVLPLEGTGVFPWSLVSPARAAGQNYFMAEGLFVNGQLEESFVYYQASLSENTADKALTVKILERLIELSKTLGKKPLIDAYSRNYTQLTGIQPPGTARVEYSGVPAAVSHARGTSGLAAPRAVPSSRAPEKARPVKESGIKAQFLVYSSGFKPFELLRRLTVEEAAKINVDRVGLIDSLTLEAKRGYAENQGYRASEFGSDNYKMVKIHKVSYRIYDEKWGDTLASEGQVDDSTALGRDPRDSIMMR